MKILLVHNFYGSGAPSGENTVYLAERKLLCRSGHRVVEFTRHSDEIRGRGAAGVIAGGFSAPWNPFTGLRLADTLKREQPDVMHVHNTFPLISPSLFHAARAFPVATVLTLHNYRLFCAAGIPERFGVPCTDCLERRSVLPALRHGCYRGSRLATLPMAAMIARGGFNVHAATPSHADDLWSLLDTTGGNRAQPAEQSIQAFGDEDSVNWNLNTELGHNYRLAVSNGSSANLRFTGLLPGSIFAGELLVSEKNFKQLYPDVTAPRYFLLDTPPGREEAVAAALRRNLGEMGLEVRGTRELLSAYLGVQNTYLSTFLALGGLGLLLGTLGLVTLLLRGALERRREFALMLATGFRREELTALLVWENAGLLIAGLLLGTVSALVAIIPQLLSAETHINWLALAALLVATLVVSLPACILAARAATSGKLLEALRGE